MKPIGMFLGMFVSVALAQQPQNALPQWSSGTVAQSPLAVSEYEDYYAIPGCMVSVRKDRAGLMISASDEVNAISYNTTIITRQGQPARVTNRSHFATKPLSPVLGVGRNVFLTNCLQHVSRLPAEVRKLFFGYQGVK